MKPKSLFPELTQKQLIALMTHKQKVFVEDLKREGSTFEIKNVNQRPVITNIIRGPSKKYSVNYGYLQQEDYDYDQGGDFDDMGVDGWGN